MSHVTQLFSWSKSNAEMKTDISIGTDKTLTGRTNLIRMSGKELSD